MKFILFIHGDDILYHSFNGFVYPLGHHENDGIIMVINQVNVNYTHGLHHHFKTISQS